MALTAQPQAVIARGPAPSPPGRFGSRLKRSQRAAGYLFVLPTLALFLAFVGWPIVQTIYLSLSKWSGFGAKTFVGLDNYTRMVADPVARHALVVTLIFTAATTVVQTVLGIVIAVLVNEVWRKVGIVVRTILFIPGIVSFVVSGVLWKLIYDPNVGTLNRLLGAVGLEGLQHTWLADRSTVLPAIIIVAIWGGVGMNMLIFFAGIQGIDPGLYEAAEVDGANPLQRFFHITVPSLRVVTGIVISLGLLNGFKIFDIIYVMTGGGPNHATEVFGTYLYSLAFGSTSGSLPQFGYASAFSVVVMIMCILAVMVQMGITRRAER
jgi:multiple sugar transport system permease protein/raffinose/stachyose/melibiose transport system permease protein